MEPQENAKCLLFCGSAEIHDTQAIRGIYRRLVERPLPRGLKPLLRGGFEDSLRGAFFLMEGKLVPWNCSFGT
jgi:hypothetical protein